MSVAVILISLLAAVETTAEPCLTLEMFSREGCPHCAEARGFLRQLAAREPNLEIEIRDVEREPEAAERLRQLGREHGVATLGVPTFHLCGRFTVGFSDAATTGALLEAWIRGVDDVAPDSVTVPILGSVSWERLGLPLFTVVLGLVDGFNPCAIWVLLFLLSVLVNVRDRQRVVVVAATFVIVSGVAYYAFMAAWLSIFILVGMSRWVQIVLAILAIGVGCIHVKDFLAWGKGPSLSIPDSVKPHIYSRVRGIVNAESLPAALGGAIVLAVLVNVVEILCTAGIPAVYTRVLTLQDLPIWEYHAYLVLYNLAYVFDDSLLVIVVVVTMRKRKLQEGEGRWLKLVSGAVVLILGLLLLFAPGWIGG